MTDTDGRSFAMKAIKGTLPADARRKFERELSEEAAICFTLGVHQNLISVRGVLPLLDEESYLQSGTDLSFVMKLRAAHPSSAHLA